MHITNSLGRSHAKKNARIIKRRWCYSFGKFRKEDKSVPIKEDHKMYKKQMLKELKANGFKVARSYDKLPWQHMVFC